MNRMINLLATSIALLSATAAGAAPTLSDLLVANRSAIGVGPRGLTGPGGAIVAKAVAPARIVALGEDHLSQEIPAFGMAVCDLMAPDLAVVVVEAGPNATAAVARTMHRPDAKARMATFVEAYPNAVAFLDFRNDYDFAEHCSRKARLAGIDQEFVGAGSLIIDNILATELSAEARQAFVALKADDARHVASAKVSGNPSELTIFAIGQDDLDRYAALLDKGGTPAARAQFDAIRVSHDLYAMNAGGNDLANGTRASMMKGAFAAAVPAGARALVKLGDWHLYKGVNPLNERDIGNFIAEREDRAGTPSLHILILGSAGTHADFAGFAKPVSVQPFKLADQPGYGWTKLASDSALPGSWTLFDLRPLRHADIAGTVDVAWRSVINGYDLLVLVPVLDASKQVDK